MDGITGSVEGDHAVLLTADGECGRAGEQPVGGDVERLEPGTWIDGGAGGVRRGGLRDDLAGRCVHEDGLGRLGRRVDAEHQV